MAHGRSFRQARNPELLQRGKERFHISGQWQRFGPLCVEVDGLRRKIEIAMQGKPVQRRNDLMESLPVLVDAPHARKLVDGTPGERRHWLDGLIMVCQQPMIEHYKRYLRSVMQRNRLMRRGATGSETDIWEQQLVRYGQKIIQSRFMMIDKVNEYLAEEDELAESRLSLSLKLTAPAEEVAWLEQLKANRGEDTRLGALRYGPHCDQLRIDYQGREIRSAGSRGQQKITAIVLKLAEHRIRRVYRGIAPAMLLDDCLEALDPVRQCRLLTRLGRTRAQVLLTAPSGSGLPKGVDMAVYELDGRSAARKVMMPGYIFREEAV